MIPNQTFRSSMHGFHREDVIHYIEMLNNQHNEQIEQIKNQHREQMEQLAAQNREQLTELRQELDQAREQDELVESLREQLEQAEARIRELEEAITAPAPVPVSVPAAENVELETYRRAERTERMAKERARQICDRANGVLAEMTVKAETVSNQIGNLANQLADQMEQYRAAVLETKESFRQSVDALAAIQPDM